VLLFEIAREQTPAANGTETELLGGFVLEDVCETVFVDEVSAGHFLEQFVVELALAAVEPAEVALELVLEVVDARDLQFELVALERVLLYETLLDVGELQRVGEALDEELDELVLREVRVLEDLADDVALDEPVLVGAEDGQPLGVAVLLLEEGLVVVPAAGEAGFAEHEVRAEDALVLAAPDGPSRGAHRAVRVVMD